MNRRFLTMIGIAGIFGAISIFAADIWIRSAGARVAEPVIVQPTVPTVPMGTIVVANAPLRYGMGLDRASLVEIAWPEDRLPSGAFRRIDDIVAQGPRLVLSPIEPNEPVLLAKLSGPDGRATLANRLSPGMRAVAIRTDEVAGVGGFIAPGDRVDIVLTRDAGAVEEVARAASGAAGSTMTSEFVLEDVRVLTVGQGTDERQTGPQIVNSVTVEVTAEGARRIALARTVGTLSLSLRAVEQAGEGAAGLTTISAFGGSIAEKLSRAVESATVAMEDDKPQMRKIVVTRGMEAQTYEVLATGE